MVGIRSFPFGTRPIFMGNSMFLGRGTFETKDVVQIVILPKVVAEIFFVFSHNNEDLSQFGTEQQNVESTVSIIVNHHIADIHVCCTCCCFLYFLSTWQVETFFSTEGSDDIAFKDQLLKELSASWLGLNDSCPLRSTFYGVMEHFQSMGSWFRNVSYFYAGNLSWLDLVRMPLSHQALAQNQPSQTTKLNFFG